jgi:transposase
VAGQAWNRFPHSAAPESKDPVPFSKASYRKRHLVENFFERIKNWCVAIRYNKFAQNILRLRLPRGTLVSLLW